MRSSEAISLRPIVGFSDAPTTAIDFGRNSVSSRILDLPVPGRAPLHDVMRKAPQQPDRG